MTDEYILGISGIDGYNHDNSIAFAKNGRIVFAAAEERYSRIKHDGAIPQKAIFDGLKFLGVTEKSISKIAVGYPKRKIISLVYNKHFYELIVLMIDLLIFRNFFLFVDIFKIIMTMIKGLRGNKSTLPINLSHKPLVYVDHHLAHAASAHYTSGYSKSVTIILDAYGTQMNNNYRAGAIYLGENDQLTEVLSIPFYASLGLFYQGVTLSLGFTPGDGEGKTMGLAAYGDPNHCYADLRAYCPHFENGIWQKSEGWLGSFFSSTPQFYGLFYSSQFGRQLKALKKKAKPEDIAAAAQRIIEEEIVTLVSFLIHQHPTIHNYALAGGLFLNVKANKKIYELNGIEDVYVHPCAGDGGTAFGAALVESTKIKFGKKTKLLTGGLGSEFTNQEILKELKRYKSKVIFKKYHNIASYTAGRITAGKVVGWFQGRSEWGPRALGFRSVIADPRDIQVKERINHVLKNREWFMPFAPSVLEERAGDFFRNCKSSPFMTIVFDIVKGKEKLIPAAIHIDNTARPNTVSKANNKLYYDLLKAFYKKTGLPIVLNTSFNRHGLPIVNSPKDAIDHLLMEAVDELIIGSYSVLRK